MLRVLVYKNNLYYSKDFKTTGGASSLPLRALRSSQHDSVIFNTNFLPVLELIRISLRIPMQNPKRKWTQLTPGWRHGIHTVLLITDPDAYN
jgi:hypothetical protein